jgi:hypothetical protein
LVCDEPTAVGAALCATCIEQRGLGWTVVFDLAQRIGKLPRNLIESYPSEVRRTLQRMRQRVA